MEKMMKFLLDDSGTAESTSTVVMIAFAGIALAAGLTAWYANLSSFFSNAGSGLAAEGSLIPSGLPTGS
jgi:hypothetical protein